MPQALSAPALTVDPYFAKLLPPLTEEERTGLEVDLIAAGGANDAVVVWVTPSGELVIVDGHNRYEICQRHELPFPIRELEFESREAAARWMINHNLHRRNFTAEQRRYYIGWQYNSEKKQSVGRPTGSPNKKTLNGEAQAGATGAMNTAKNGQKNGHTNGSAKPAAPKEPTTAERIAAEQDMSPRAVQQAGGFHAAIEAIAEVGGEEVRHALVNGTVKSTKGDVEKLAALPTAQRRNAAQQIARGEVSSVREALDNHTAADAATDTAGGPAESEDAAEQPKDRFGVAMPGAAQACGEANLEIETLAKQISKSLKRLGELADEPAGRYLPMPRIANELKNALNAIRGAKFHSLCPHCQGNACEHCKETGWITQSVYNNLPHELRNE